MGTFKGRIFTPTCRSCWNSSAPGTLSPPGAGLCWMCGAAHAPLNSAQVPPVLARPRSLREYSWHHGPGERGQAGMGFWLYWQCSKASEHDVVSVTGGVKPKQARQIPPSVLLGKERIWPCMFLETSWCYGFFKGSASGMTWYYGK